jgi:hypothetical protein
MVITGEILTAAAAPAGETSRRTQDTTGVPGTTTATTTTERPQETPISGTNTQQRSPATNAGQNTGAQGEERRQPTPATAEGAPVPPSVTDAADSLGALLAGSPVSEVYLVPSTVITAETLNRVRLRAGAAGVRVYDLTSCYALPKETESCRGDIAATQYRFIALRALEGLDGDGLKAAMTRLERMEAEARDDGRMVVLTAPQVPAADTTPGSPGRIWEALTSRPSTVAAVTGGPAGAGSAGAHHVRTPAMGSPASGPTSAAPALSLVTLLGSRASDLTLSRPFQRAPSSGVAPAARNGWLRRLHGLGDRLGEPARSAVFWIGVLVAFLTVAALWKVPKLAWPASPKLLPNGGATDTNAGSQQVLVVEEQPQGVFASNLGRTVLSGLTGVAVLSLMKEIWGISGTVGQGFFVTVFIEFFFIFLVLSALIRGAIDASVTRSASGYVAPTLTGVRWKLWRGILERWRSGRSARIAFFDSFVNVLFGQGRSQAGIWEARFSNGQERTLSTIEAVRQEISSAIGDALQRCGYRAAEPEDYRVNISILAEKGGEAFYIATALRSNPQVFGAKSMAYVTAVGRFARWWKKPYMGGHQVLVSDAAFATAWLAGGGVATLTIKRTGAADLSVTIPINGERLCDFLRRANERTALGGAIPAAVIWAEASGRLVIADLEPNQGALTGAVLQFPGGVAVNFAPAVINEAALVRNPDPTRFPGAANPMMIGTYFEDRDRDYEAFVLLPLPWPRRGPLAGDRRGNIHISFRRAHHLDAIWSGLEHIVTPAGGAAAQVEVAPNYSKQQNLLTPDLLPDGALLAVLRQGVRVLGEVIHNLSDTWLKDHGRVNH